MYVQGFDKADMSDEELVAFFVMFDGAETVKKRVFRDHSSGDVDNEGGPVWRFSGNVFVTFDTEAAARAFYLAHSGLDGPRLPLTYKGDKLQRALGIQLLPPGPVWQAGAGHRYTQTKARSGNC